MRYCSDEGAYEEEVLEERNYVLLGQEGGAFIQVRSESSQRFGRSILWVQTRSRS